MIQSGKLMYI